MVVLRGVIGGLFLLCLMACKAGDGAACAKNEDCANRLTCHEYECVNIERMKQIKAEKAKVAADRATCNRYVDYGRGRKNECYDYGRCSVNALGECVASNNQDCESSRECQEHGNCGYAILPKVWEGAKIQFNTCSPRNVSDCLRSNQCKTRNSCLLEISKSKVESLSKNEPYYAVTSVMCNTEANFHYAKDNAARFDNGRIVEIIQSNPFWQKED